MSHVFCLIRFFFSFVVIVIIIFSCYQCYYNYHFVYHHQDNWYFCFHLHHHVECPNITFKNSWYIISVDGESWYWGRHTCSSLGGDLVSFETQEEWSLINDEIQRRNTTNYENKWRIGLKKRARNWTWVSGRPLTISKWGQGEPSSEHDAAFMYKRFRNGEQGVFGSDNGTSGKKQHAYICEIPESELICCCCCCCFSFFLMLF